MPNIYSNNMFVLYVQQKKINWLSNLLLLWIYCGVQRKQMFFPGMKQETLRICFLSAYSVRIKTLNICIQANNHK